MKMPNFDYACPETLEEVVALLAKNEGAKILSGGQSLVPILAFRMSYPTMLVDLRKLKGLDGIEITDKCIRIGGRVRWVQIEQDDRLADAHPLLQFMISHVAHYQIRNKGTVGGSLAHADPAAEMPGLAMVCDCEIHVTGAAGRRILPVSDFFAGALETVLDSTEVITAVHFPPWPKARKWAFQEFSRRRGDFAIAGVAVFYDDVGGRVANAHCGVIGVGQTPHRVAEVEELLNGETMSLSLIERAKAVISLAVDPMDDLHGSAEYRRSLAGTLLERTLKAASGLSRGMPS